MSGEFLDLMARGSFERLAVARERSPQSELELQIEQLPPAPRLRLDAAGFDLIAEVKLRSPASGALHAAGSDTGDEAIAARAAAYAAAGAAAVSVLTEPSRFDGALSHLSAAAQALASLPESARIPAMRKDFLIDPYQVYEARAAGAGGVLLIVRMLSPEQQRAMLQACARLGVFALLEAFDERDLTQAQARVQEFAGRVPLLVGINCRDLATLAVRPERLEALAAQLPAGVPHVAESGVTGAAEAARVARLGYRLALVGSALMRASAPAGLAREMLAAARAAAAGTACGSRSAD